MYILGLNESHVATAAVLHDGVVVACASEERFNRRKGGFGFPRQAVAYCLAEAGIESSQLDLVVIGFNNPGLFLHDLEDESRTGTLVFLRWFGPWVMRFLKRSSVQLPIIDTIYEWLYAHFYKRLMWPYLRRIHFQFISQYLGIARDKIVTVDHHLAHAYAVFYSYPKEAGQDYLVIVNDGIGDDTCGDVYRVSGSQWQRLATTLNRHSLAYLYQFTTQILGLKPNEHEYKVMGLAPYASAHEVDRVYPIFKRLIWLDGLSFSSRIPTLGYYYYLKQHLAEKRFDAIAGAAQRLTEELLVQQVREAIRTTGISRLVVAGGIYMNIKANQAIAALPEVIELQIMPSAGDESTAIGAAYWGYQKMCQPQPFVPQALVDLYLGPRYSDQEIVQALDAAAVTGGQQFSVLRLEQPAAEIAKLLADGAIVARFSGRMEFGARALGNRSILANPSRPETIKIINEKIKNRDFWMPFAPVVRQERAADYLLINHKTDLAATYMMVGYETTALARRDLAAALHPADHTARPQILARENNPEYYEILEAFDALTGIGGLLNTSFNLHGEPIVCTPTDALRVFLLSGLDYLVLENYLIAKK